MPTSLLLPALENGLGDRVGVGLETRDDLAGDRPLDEPLDVAKEPLLVDAHERHRGPG